MEVVLVEGRVGRAERVQQVLSVVVEQRALGQREQDHRRVGRQAGVQEVQRRVHRGPECCQQGTSLS
jgi:hypothetical protein